MSKKNRKNAAKSQTDLKKPEANGTPEQQMNPPSTEVESPKDASTTTSEDAEKLATETQTRVDPPQKRTEDTDSHMATPKFTVNIADSITLHFLSEFCKDPEIAFSEDKTARVFMKTGQGAHLDTVMDIARFLCRKSSECKEFYEGTRNPAEVSVLDTTLTQIAALTSHNAKSVLKDLENHMETNKIQFLALDNRFSLADLMLYEAILTKKLNIKNFPSITEWMNQMSRMFDEKAAKTATQPPAEESPSPQPDAPPGRAQESLDPSDTTPGTTNGTVAEAPASESTEHKKKKTPVKAIKGMFSRVFKAQKA